MRIRSFFTLIELLVIAIIARSSIKVKADFLAAMAREKLL